MHDREPDRDGESDAELPSTAPGDSEGASERRAHNRSLLRRYVTDVLGDGKMEVIDEIFHEDIELETRDGRTIAGPQAVKEYLASVRDRFADLETELDSVVADRTTVMARFRVTAVHENEYFGVSATNREVTFRVFSRGIVEDGKMIEQGDLVNPLRMQPPSKRHSRSTVLEQIRDGVVVVDRDDRVVDVNPVAEEMFGTGDRDVRNEPLETLIDPDVDLPAAGSSAELPLDDDAILDVSVSTLTDLQDEPIGRILVVRDVTERARRRQQLEVLSRQNERLDEFASLLSHDLRNPLMTASGFLEVARETGEEEHFEKVATAHDRMETMIDELLTMTRAGMTVEETEPVALAALAETAWGTVRTEGARLRVEVPPELTVTADRDLLQHVLENLFRNAIEHNEPPLTVTVGTPDDAASADGFYVADDGRGIPPEEREDVFDHGYTTETDGTGFGLSIVSEFVEAHGWDITVTEGSDGGARFEIATDPEASQA